MTATREIYPFHEFFAGSGLVSCGLAPSFKSVWSNDISPRKAEVYKANLDQSVFHLGNIAEVKGETLPNAKLSWASFPCQDLSLAGNIDGIYSERSGLVWQWIRIIDELGKNAPHVICLENVQGLVSAHNGDDYRHLHAALAARGYQVGTVLINARLFVPQSRPRVFVIGTRGPIPQELLASDPGWAQPAPVRKLGSKLDDFIWWNLPLPRAEAPSLASIVEVDVPFDRRDAAALIPEKHLDKLRESGVEYATGYRRTRYGRQVMEVRCDGVAGCLRTPAGGSSRQYLIHNGANGIEARLFTIREVARLMGAPEEFELPGSYNDGYFAMGDAVAAPVAHYLSEMLLRPLVEAAYHV